MTEPMTRREFIKAGVAGVASLFATRYLGLGAPIVDPLRPPRPYLDGEQVKKILDEEQPNLGRLSKDLNIPPIAQKYFNELSLDVTGKDFDQTRQTMCEGLVQDPANPGNPNAPWEPGGAGEIKHAYLYIYRHMKDPKVGALAFRNKDQKITLLKVEPYDPKSGETIPY
jgi:hypothetical protein